MLLQHLPTRQGKRLKLQLSNRQLNYRQPMKQQAKQVQALQVRFLLKLVRQQLLYPLTSSKIATLTRLPGQEQHQGEWGSAGDQTEAVGAPGILPARPSAEQVSAARQMAAEVQDCLKTTVKPDTMMILPALPFPPPKRKAGTSALIAVPAHYNHHLWSLTVAIKLLSLTFDDKYAAT
jgi:hypothetical protein